MLIHRKTFKWFIALFGASIVPVWVGIIMLARLCRAMRQRAERRSDYLRAMTACLEARGYSVR
ncbi:hypothetical protein [Marinobacter sp. ANT_B65]|uniref:hypothetical protein n=1 Tax=Marinobacter sp. ANT_B65 TaxID=2039467 RepID=UPI00117C8FDD|nr:hypothetical protein [Marinobacter sp. ANT_B65]